MNHHLTRLLTVFLSLAVAPALAAERKPFPKELPAFGADKPLPVPKILKSTTPEGLTVWLVPREGFPKVTVILAARGGTAADPKGKEGLTSLLASTLSEGTATRTSRQIAEELQAVGGSLQVEAADDAIYLQADGLASGADTVLSVVADVARNASFPAQEVALAKANALQDLQVKSSQPQFLAQKTFAEAVFGKHPYHVVSPTAAVISGATPEVLKKEFSRRFRPDGALLVIAGAFDAEAVSQAVTKSFGGWKGSGSAPAATPQVPAPKGREILFVSRPGSVQSVIMIGRVGVHASDPAYFPSLVANTVFGGGFAGRLMENIREDKGYSYSPWSNLSSYQQGGALQVNVQVRNEVTAATLLELIYELDRMGATDVTAEDLQTAQRVATGRYLLNTQSQWSVAYVLATNWVKGLPPEFLGEYVPKVNAVTSAQIREAGKKLFASSSQTVVVVGDDKVKAELEQFGPVRVVKQ
ncbi:M16 family metallopeptidase [Hyalangium versicolor]|uniref:M16 family metallopeptidase n=1 Tax=Hyalangium versicolor TaxID=2861190 RepID=UPI001CCE30DA|nr:pitrilysin family protein [Hyalangium versicolor]